MPRGLDLLLALATAIIVVSCAHAKIGYFWHITDIHYDSMFSENGDTRRGCWLSSYDNGGSSRGNRRPLGRFGDFSCDAPWDLIESAAAAMQRLQGDNIEFVLWTGDALSHTANRLHESRQVELLRNVTDLLKRTFSSQFVFPALGHDDPLLRRNLGQLWSRWLPPDSMHTFEKGGYYMIERKMKKLQIVVLNTNLMTGPPRQQEVRKDIDDEAKKQWEWLEMVLHKCMNNKEVVYLVGHHPPGADERQRGALPPPHAAYTDHHNRKYLRVIRKYAEIIVGQFFGHLHSDTFRIVYNEKGRPISWAMVAPSVTPRRTTDGPNNPGLRLYKFDTDTGQVLDYTQFYLDLSTANKMEEAEWIPEYNLTSHYALSNVTPLSLHNLADKFTQISVSENTAFSRYFSANSVRMYTTPQMGGCDTSCAHTHYCAITRLDYREYRHCLETAASALASATALASQQLGPRLASLIFFLIPYLLR